jgi:hypothetical protein
VGDQGSPIDTVGPAAERPVPDVLQLHLAEYEALMTRSSYLLQVQYAFWPVALVILAVAAQIWSSDKAHRWLLVWSTLIMSMVIAIVWGDKLYRHEIDESTRTRCPQCGLKVEQVPQLPGKAPFSKDFEDAVGLACESASARQVARQFRLAASTVRAIDLRYLERWSTARKMPALALGRG